MMGPPTLAEATAALKASVFDGVTDPAEFHRLMVEDYVAVMRAVRAALHPDIQTAAELEQ